MNERISGSCRPDVRGVLANVDGNAAADRAGRYQCRVWHLPLNARHSTSAPPADVVALEALEAVRRERAGAAAQACIDHLSTVDLQGLPDASARLAFWLNTYNALLRHALLRLEPRGSVVTNLLLFERAVWWVGGHRLSLGDIEHGVLRRNQRALPFFWRRPFSPTDPRQALVQERLEPRLHFALNCGAVSCPPIRAYTAGAVDAQLDTATRSYLSQATRLDRARSTVTLSALLKLYASDFGDRVEAVRFTARHLDGDDGAWLLANATAVRVRYGAYDWSLVPLA
jgi:hypothetical protein